MLVFQVRFFFLNMKKTEINMFEKVWRDVFGSLIFFLFLFFLFIFFCIKIEKLTSVILFQDFFF